METSQTCEAAVTARPGSRMTVAVAGRFTHPTVPRQCVTSFAAVSSGPAIVSEQVRPPGCVNGGLLPAIPEPTSRSLDRSTDMFSQLKNSAARFLAQEDGPTAVEYAVMLALIIAVCIAAITTLANNANSTFSK